MPDRMTPTLPIVEAPDVRCAPPVERPILFSAPMVRALLAGTKTQTRRVCKPQPEAAPGMECTRLRFKRKDGSLRADFASVDPLIDVFCPYGVAGDRLWVRETLTVCSEGLEYSADEELFFDLAPNEENLPKFNLWNHYAHEDGPDVHPTTIPSIFMPRWASRISLELTGVRVERVTEISDEDAKAEGVALTPCPHPEAFHDAPCPNGQYRINYAVLWNQINGKTHPWASDPFVWVLTFKRITP